MKIKCFTAATLLILCFMFCVACGNNTDNTIPDTAGNSGSDISDDTQQLPNQPEPAEKTYTVTFDYSDGSTKNTVSVKEGETVKAPQTIQRENYEFSGWLDGVSAVEFPYTVTKNVTLRASWTYIDPDFYSQPEDEMTVVYGEKNGPSCEARLKKGYVFTYQWYKNSTASKEGATAVEGGTDRVLHLPRSIKPGDVSYYYCEITQKKINSDETGVFYSGFSKVTVKQGRTNILIVGSGTVRQNTIHDSVEFLKSLLKAGGHDVSVDRITNSSNYNIWEEGLTGKDQSKIRELLEDKMYSYIILQMGRDYAVCTEKTRNNELTAYNNIISMMEETEQECEFILIQGPWRQDLTSKYYVERFIPAGIDTNDKHKEAIKKYFDEYLIPVQPAKISDMITAFELAQAAGIDPYGSPTNDFPGTNGSYLLACVNYINITGQSPEGLNVTSDSIGKVSAADAAVLQKIAAQVVLGS